RPTARAYAVPVANGRSPAWGFGPSLWRLWVELGERLPLRGGVVEELADRPRLARALVRGGPVQHIFARARVGAGHDTPRAAIPLLDHRLRDAGGRVHQ